MRGGGKGKKIMLPNSDSLFWKWKIIYEELLDPFTGTVGEKYFYPILKTHFQHFKNLNSPFSIFLLDIENMPSNSSKDNLILENYLILRDIADKIRKWLDSDDMIFYNGKQQFLFILPHNKNTVKEFSYDIVKELSDINIREMPIVIKGGYAEFPSDANTLPGLEESANKALFIANKCEGNKIIGYFNERRTNTRAAVSIEIKYSAEENNNRLTCSRNICTDGIMISGLSDLPLGDNIKITFNLPTETQDKITVMAKSIWNKISVITQKMDMGLCFTQISSSAKEKIKNFIAKIPPEFTHL